ncbi:MAG: cation:proton antiporter [Caulobacterales bacterium]
MSFFESLLALLAVAILLLQVSRRLSIPYPTMLAAAGVCLALIPGAPNITLEPHTALALFIAPILVDAAFDFPVGAVRRLWRPLFALAVMAVALSAGAVAWIGVTMGGLPLYAALALGAIVAPPDAAAATAVLSSVSMPRRSVAVLKGESLLNDASALLLFTAATSFHSQGGIDNGAAVKLAFAAPGGVLLGILLAKAYRRFAPIVAGTLGGNLMEFITSFGVWIIAERLGISPVLCLVAFAMTIARSASLRTRPRARIHSFAVWETIVFLLNVLAFLLMGFQARTIVSAMEPERLKEAVWFALNVVACLIVVRLAWVLIYNRLAQSFRVLSGDFKPPSVRHGILIGWCGMRGLVTLATAFALPADFPQRDLIVLTAFAVVLATLVVQGLTLAPLVRLLKLDGEDGLDKELAEVRAELAQTGLATLEGRTGPAIDHWRYAFEAASAAALAPGDSSELQSKRQTGLAAIRQQRQRLEELRKEQRVGADAFLILQEELDFHEVSLSTETERRIEES